MLKLKKLIKNENSLVKETEDILDDIATSDFGEFEDKVRDGIKKLKKELEKNQSVDGVKMIEKKIKSFLENTKKEVFYFRESLFKEKEKLKQTRENSEKNKSLILFFVFIASCILIWLYMMSLPVKAMMHDLKINTFEKLLDVQFTNLFLWFFIMMIPAAIGGLITRVVIGFLYRMFFGNDFEKEIKENEDRIKFTYKWEKEIEKIIGERL